MWLGCFEKLDPHITPISNCYNLIAADSDRILHTNPVAYTMLVRYSLSVSSLPINNKHPVVVPTSNLPNGIVTADHTLPRATRIWVAHHINCNLIIIMKPSHAKVHHSVFTTQAIPFLPLLVCFIKFAHIYQKMPQLGC